MWVPIIRQFLIELEGHNMYMATKKSSWPPPLSCGMGKKFYAPPQTCALSVREYEGKSRKRKESGRRRVLRQCRRYSESWLWASVHSRGCSVYPAPLYTVLLLCSHTLCCCCTSPGLHQWTKQQHLYNKWKQFENINMSY